MLALELALLASFWNAVQDPAPHPRPTASNPSDPRFQEQQPSPLILGADVALKELRRVVLRTPLGREDLALDSADDLHALARFATTVIASDGRVLVQDGQDGAVHVFDPADGRRLFVCNPLVSRRCIVRRVLAVDASNRIFVQRDPIEPEFDVFGPDGTLHETWRPRDGELLALPGSFAFGREPGEYWNRLSGRGVVRVDDGRDAVELRTRPDGWKWRWASIDVAADGTLAIIDTPEQPPSCGLCGLGWKPTSDPGPRSFLFVFDHDGHVRRRLELPVGVERGRLFAGIGWLGLEDLEQVVHIVELRTDQMRALRVPADVPRFATWGFPAQRTTRELWCIDPDTRSLVCFELPDTLAK